jgi:hypothetical protein
MNNSFEAGDPVHLTNLSDVTFEILEIDEDSGIAICLDRNGVIHKFPFQSLNKIFAD